MVKLLLLTGALGAVSGALGAPLTTSSSARTPALGWSSWSYFATAINESLILDMGDAMVETGLARLGFEYINVDAGALVRGRDNATGKLQVNNERFPRGMRYLADELHAKGLKLGVYTDLGDGSCGPGPGSFGHYAQDAQQVANEWRADYLKVDFCGQHVSRTDPAVQLVAWQALSSAVARAAGKKAVVVAINPAAVLTPWVDKVAATLLMNVPGLEMGNALVDMLWGDVVPSGKLPITIPTKDNQVGFSEF